MKKRIHCRGVGTTTLRRPLAVPQKFFSPGQYEQVPVDGHVLLTQQRLRKMTSLTLAYTFSDEIRAAGAADPAYVALQKAIEGKKKVKLDVVFVDGLLFVKGRWYHQQKGVHTSGNTRCPLASAVPGGPPPSSMNQVGTPGPALVFPGPYASTPGPAWSSWTTYPFSWRTLYLPIATPQRPQKPHK